MGHLTHTMPNASPFLWINPSSRKTNVGQYRSEPPIAYLESKSNVWPY